MKIFPYFVLVTITLLCVLPSDINGEKKVRKKRFLPIAVLVAALPQALTILNGAYTVWKIVHDYKKEKEQEKVQAEMFRSLNKISDQIKQLDIDMKNTLQTAVATLLRAFPKVVRLELLLHDIFLIRNHISFTAEQMHNYIEEGIVTLNTTNLEVKSRFLRPVSVSKNFTLLEEMSKNLSGRAMNNFTMIDFATWSTSANYNALPSLLSRLHDIITSTDPKGLFDQILDTSIEMHWYSCTLRHSPYQTMYNMFLSILGSSVQGSAIMQFAYTVLESYGLGDFSAESRIAKKTFQKQTMEKLESLIKVLPRTDRAYFKCEPPSQKEGTTYTSVVQFMQVYLVNEIDLNSDNSCKWGCGYYTDTYMSGCFNKRHRNKHKRNFCQYQSRCRGEIWGCFGTAKELSVCRSSYTDRRYDWISYSGYTYGKSWYCPDYNTFDLQVWRRKRIFSRCEYCLCMCDGVGSGSDRYFNLRKVYADMDKNKVVTGVRIVKKNQIIHLQIQQADLGPLATVNQSTVSWKPVEDYTTDSMASWNYYTLDYYQRSIDLNHVSATPGYVLTGIKFRQRGLHLDLDAYVTPFNFVTGKLILEPANLSYWISNNSSNPQTGSQRTEIILGSPEVPTEISEHWRGSKKYNFIKFQPSDFYKDLSQVTVPYLDSQPVTSNGYALSGFGLIHRGKWGSGGYVAPILISYDVVPHLADAIKSGTP